MSRVRSGEMDMTMAEHGNDITDVLTDEQIERLREGEELTFLTKKREPVLDDEEPSSMNTISLQLSTKGVIGDSSLEETFPDVIGL